VRFGQRGSGVPVDPEQVRKARLEAGLTLGAVAGTDVSRAFISQVERGISRPSAEVLRLIARRTHKPLSYFIPPQKRTQAATAELSSELTTTANRLARFISMAHLSKSERETLRLVEYSIRRAAALATAIK
jgi:transcriptional regulator with XRE-family HTH domain